MAPVMADTTMAPVMAHATMAPVLTAPPGAHMATTITRARTLTPANRARLPRPEAVATLLAATLVLCFCGCERSEVKLDVEFPVAKDAGADAGCAAFADLGCVNYVKFQLSNLAGTHMATECLKVEKRLTTLCDLKSLARGTALFREDRGETVQVKMWGLRVFPATSCEVNPECDARILFSGSSDWVKLGEVAGGSLPLRVTSAQACGPKEVYRPKGDRDCFAVCDYTEPVCDMSDGCVCLMPETGAPDGATSGSFGPDSGVWVLLDAGTPR